jgi:hypothetical protein
MSPENRSVYAAAKEAGISAITAVLVFLNRAGIITGGDIFPKKGGKEFSVYRKKKGLKKVCTVF